MEVGHRGGGGANCVWEGPGEADTSSVNRVERPTQNDAAVYQTAGDDNIKGVFFLEY